MASLKRKNLGELESAQTGALPQSMLRLERGAQLQTIPLTQLYAAPAEWNFYSPLTENKLLELIESIRENGLLHPIVVWKRDDGYMILSGHNRVEAYRRLWKNSGEAKYQGIACNVREGLSEEEAQELIIDSNWVQRTLSTVERVRSISAKYASLGRKRRARGADQHGRTYDLIAADYGLSGRQVARYVQLANLSDDLLARLDLGELSVRAACKYALLDPSVQDEILDYYDPLPDDKRASKLRKKMTLPEVLAILKEEQAEPMETVKFRVSASRKAALESMVAAWLRENG